MKTRFAFMLVASFAFAAMPALAQHGSHSSNSLHGKSASHGKSGADKSVSEKLSDNTKLSSKLQSLLPAGTNMQTAAQGFKNMGQFVAAVHVSHNLGIPFDQLKAKMMGPPKESLGKAITALKPTANAKTETKKAEKQAKQDMDDSSQPS